MGPVVFSERAQRQLLDLYDFIAESSSAESAHRFTVALVEHCASLADFPSRGASHHRLYPGLRTLVFRARVTIAYGVEKDTVTILGIFYAGRDWENDLSL